MAAARWNSYDSRSNPPQRVKTAQIALNIFKNSINHSKMSIRASKELFYLEMIKKLKVLKSLILLLRRILLFPNTRRKEA
jgi:predicted nuclease of restriction endonuclease-like RecB superfamily